MQSSRTESPRRQHVRHRLAVVVLALALVAAVMQLAPAPSSATSNAPMVPPTTNDPPETSEPEPTTTSEAEPVPEPPPPPAPECDDPAGFARPANVRPGYIYSPTLFTGTVVDPQPDDTFAADAPGHTPFVGKLRTRVNERAGGVPGLCARRHQHSRTTRSRRSRCLVRVVTRAPSQPRVVVIDAAGQSIGLQPLRFRPAAAPPCVATPAPPQCTKGSCRCGSRSPSTLREPGFTVRVEIRGTAALPGGSTQVMGADEVFVHLGPTYPNHASTVIEEVGRGRPRRRRHRGTARRSGCRRHLQLLRAAAAADHPRGRRRHRRCPSTIPS